MDKKLLYKKLILILNVTNYIDLCFHICKYYKRVSFLLIFLEVLCDV